ncbi:crs5p [Saccharomyces arboricola H-6]|uniref:Metallothionein-like protein CRS5 n=1 Tax=Saccharomyces arboricola (strain H-6 / AS 2.3317 / CBS 10644) TaxID=1160507 RepID=J8PI13_SACAR|nr:crs5p [Saccharomyces arboricola H-6]
MTVKKCACKDECCRDSCKCGTDCVPSCSGNEKCRCDHNSESTQCNNCGESCKCGATCTCEKSKCTCEKC